MLFGRDPDIQEIATRCISERLVVLEAEPGLGATTLLRQGLLPELSKRGCITVFNDEWQGRVFATNLKEKIADAVREQADDTFFAESETLSEMMTRIRARTGRPVALLLDQFEDYLRCHAGTDISDAFDADLSRAVADRRGQFVISVHQYAMPNFQRLAPYIPHLEGATFPLRGIDREAARQMLTSRAQTQGFTLEPEAAEALVSAPAAAFLDATHPYHLVAGLKSLMDAAREKNARQLTALTIEAYGSADRLIRESLDDTITSLRSNHLELFFRWCNILMSPDGAVRRGASQATLLEYSGRMNRFAMSLIPRLMELGLFRSIQTAGGPRYEYARAAMAPLVMDWRKRREAELIVQQRKRFRTTSLSVAIGSIVLVYIVWLVMTWKH